MNPGVVLALAAVMYSPPSGRPPIGPLERYEPKLYDLRFDVSLSTVIPRQGLITDQRHYDLFDAPIAMPLILQGAYSRVHQDSLYARLWLQSREDATFQRRSRVDSGFPHHTHLMVMPVERFRGTHLRWQLSYRVQSWSSKIDEKWAAKLTWPKQWPQEVQDGLRPSHLIESDEPIFARSIDRVTNGNLRMAPPYLAAKQIVRYTISRFQVSGNGTDRGFGGIIRGLNVKGASAAWQNGLGTAHDLVCTCVAMLRAANIPARPVIGVFENDEKNGRHEFISWAEFYLEGAGWIPFDPDEMRGKAINNRNLRDPWPEFGTMKDLNERIPLSYFFIPPAGLEAPWKPIVWGWDPRPGGDPSTEPAVSFTMISRGKGKEDPR